MVLVTKYKNTNFFIRVIAVTLSIILMACSAFFAIRIAETFAYTDKGAKILQGKTVTGDLSESNKIPDMLVNDLSWITNTLYLKDEKAVEEALASQKDAKLKKLLDDFKKSKSDYENNLKEMSEQSEEYDEDGNAVETTVNTAEIDKSFDREISFEYKDMSFLFNTQDFSENKILLTDSEETAKKKLEAMLESYINDKKYLENTERGYSRDSEYEPVADLKYYAVNTKNNLVCTNFENGEKPAEVLNNHNALIIKNNVPQYSEGFKNVLKDSTEIKTGELSFADKDMEYYLYVDDDANLNNGYFEEINNFYGIMEYSIKKDLIAAVILLVLSLAIALYYFVIAGTRLGNGKVKRAFIDYLPTDIHFLLTGGLITGLCALYIPLIEVLDSSTAGVSNHNLFLALAAIIAGAIWALVIEFFGSLIRVCRSEKKIYDNLLLVIVFKRFILKPIAWAFKKIKLLLTYNPDNFKPRFTRCLILYGVVNLILFIVAAATKNAIPDLLIVAFNASLIGWGTWYGVQLDRIITAAHYRTVPQVNYNKLPQSLKTLYNSLRYTQQELDTAVAKAVRDERMRSELITNVSHDLKTPLTSIITYVDLLKACKIEDENANQYLEVLDEKSNRLKRLIDDLIEASKLTSGVVTINPVNLSLTELAAQAVGERSREFTENGLELVFDGSNIITCFADGNKTFRVLENLLSNAKKYSLTGSRVYCSVYETQNFSIFEIKNISSQPLNISPKELTERFVRGDKSRTNEGNGLGLSIADNLCSAQGGHLNITIDGDLFKAQVMLPKAK